MSLERIEEGRGRRLLCVPHRAELLARTEKMRQCQRALLAQPHAAFFGIVADEHGGWTSAALCAQLERAAHLALDETVDADGAAVEESEPTADEILALASEEPSDVPPSLSPPVVDVPRSALLSSAMVAETAATGPDRSAEVGDSAQNALPVTTPDASDSCALVSLDPASLNLAAPASAAVAQNGLSIACLAAHQQAALRTEVAEALEAPDGLTQPLPASTPLSLASFGHGVVVVTRAGGVDIYACADTSDRAGTAAVHTAAPGPGSAAQRAALPAWRHVAHVPASDGGEAGASVVASSVRCCGVGADGVWRASLALLLSSSSPPGPRAACAPHGGVRGLHRARQGSVGDAPDAYGALLSTFSLAVRRGQMGGLAAAAAAEGSGAASSCSCELVLRSRQRLRLAVGRAPSAAQPLAAHATVLAPSSVRSVHAASAELSVLVLASGRAAVWAAAAQPPERAGAGGSGAAANVHLLPLPSWAAQSPVEDAPLPPAAPPAAAAGGAWGAQRRAHGAPPLPEAPLVANSRAAAAPALCVHVPCWSDQLAFGISVYGFAVWSTTRRTLLLSWGTAAAALPAACEVVCAPYLPASAHELEQLARHAAAAASGRVARPAAPPRGGAAELPAGRVVGLVTLALRPCDQGAASVHAARDAPARAGFWSCLARADADGDADGAFRAEAAPARPQPDGRLASADAVRSERARALRVQLVGLSPTEMSSVREYWPPPSLLEAPGPCRSPGSGGCPLTGWDELCTSARSVAALSRAAQLACVWDAPTCVCLATVALPGSRVGRHIFLAQAEGARAAADPAACSNSWSLWEVRCPGAFAKRPASPRALAGGGALQLGGTPRAALPGVLGKRVRQQGLSRPPNAVPSRQPLVIRQPAASEATPSQRASAQPAPSQCVPPPPNLAACSAGGGFAHPAHGAQLRGFQGSGPPLPGLAGSGLQGFRTGAGAQVALSAAALERAKRLLMDEDDEQ